MGMRTTPSKQNTQENTPMTPTARQLRRRRAAVRYNLYPRPWWQQYAAAGIAAVAAAGIAAVAFFFVI